MKIRRKILKIIFYSILIGLISCSIGIFWFKNYSWKNISTEKEMIENGLQVLNSPNLPDNFYLVYDIIKPSQRNSTLSEQIWSNILRPHEGKDCKCDDIGYASWNNDNLKLKLSTENLLKENGYLKFGFGIENFSNPKKCFDYWINNNIQFNGAYLKDLNELSEKIFIKEISLLKTDEIIMLIAWQDMLRKGRNDIEIINKRFKVLKYMYDRNKAST